MQYLYIHGAGANSSSFDYIRQHLGSNSIALDYQTSHGFRQNLTRMADEIHNYSNLFIVAHSLGGIYALHLANLMPSKFKGAVTIATPYGGSSAADVMRWIMPTTRLFKEISPTGNLIHSTMQLPLHHPWTQIVTISGGIPWLLIPNDGVVTQRSMRARPDMELIDINLNHYEVMTSIKAVEIIKDKSKKTNRF